MSSTYLQELGIQQWWRYVHDIFASVGNSEEAENVEFIDSADNDLKLRIKELLRIFIRKPKFNKQVNTSTSNVIYIMKFV